ncbi:MAG: helix-turn-helix domain-containing protein [Vulcanimicrobiaceae bacterium]
MIEAAIIAAEMAAAGKSTIEIADALGVHVRTIYKWLRRSKPPKAAPAAPPENYDPAKALLRLMSAELYALERGDSASLERLYRLGRVAAALGLRHQVTAEKYGDEERAKLMARINAMVENMRDPESAAPREPGETPANTDDDGQCPESAEPAKPAEGTAPETHQSASRAITTGLADRWLPARFPGQGNVPTGFDPLASATRASAMTSPLPPPLHSPPAAPLHLPPPTPGASKDRT